MAEDEISKADARAETTNICQPSVAADVRKTTVFVWSQSFGRCKRDWFIVQAVFGLVPELSVLLPVVRKAGSRETKIVSPNTPRSPHRHSVVATHRRIMVERDHNTGLGL